MRRKKILFCSEGHHLPTGYSVYTKEVLSRLSRDPRFEVAELACYTDKNVADSESCGWKIYPNQPPKGSDEWSEYKSHPSYEFGEYTFNHVLLDFMPDFVMDIRDWWMFEFQQRTTFRDFYHWCIMPTVDASPQNRQWMDTFASADAVFAYSEFGRDVMLGQYGGLNFIDMAPPCANSNFMPVLNKEEHRSRFGISEDAFIFGTVMRNQRRKLYPDLFKTFRQFLDFTGSTNSFLYCQTSYPDIGWEIPDLLQDYGLSNRILFTYKCKSCQHLSVSFFSDVINGCSECHKFTREIIGVNNKVEEEELASIYNLFDVYIQYANSEGFGMPQLEASQCGVPVMTIDYSAMQSVADNIGARKVPLLCLQTECETGCERAIPNNDIALDMMIEFHELPKEKLKQLGFSMKQRTLNHYNWDKTANVWAEYFAKTPVRDISETWLSAPQIFEPAPEVPSNLSVKDQVNFLFESVLGKPELIGGHQWKRTLRDITYKCTANSTDPDFYFNESHLNNNVRKWGKFDTEMAHLHMSNMRHLHNRWEEIRMKAIQGGQR